MKKIVSVLIMIILVVSLMGCSSNDDVSSESGDHSFTAKIDGESFVAREDLIFTLHTMGGGYLAIGATNNNITDTKTIDFTIEMVNPQSLTAGLEITDADQNEYEVLANYAFFDEDVDAWSDEQGGSYYVKITSVNYDLGFISGEFSFTLVDEETSETYQITEGRFTNIEF